MSRIALVVIYGSTLLASIASAELRPIDDAEMAQVHGQGIGIILDDVSIKSAEDNGAEFVLDINVDGVNGSTDNATLTLSEFALVDTQTQGGFTLGTVANPILLDVNEFETLGSDGQPLILDVLRIAAPIREPGQATFDFDFAAVFDIRENGPDEFFTFQGTGLSFAGSEIILYGDNNRGAVFTGRLHYTAEQLKFISNRAADGSNDQLLATLLLNDVSLFLPIGQAGFQPLTLTALDSGNLRFSIEPITTETAAQFLLSEPGNLTIGNVNVGGRDFGTSFLNGIRIQSLSITTRQLN